MVVSNSVGPYLRIKLVNLYVGYKEIELADLIINLENIILAIYLKERNEFVI